MYPIGPHTEAPQNATFKSFAAIVLACNVIHRFLLRLNKDTCPGVEHAGPGLMGALGPASGSSGMRTQLSPPFHDRIVCSLWRQVRCSASDRHSIVVELTTPLSGAGLGHTCESACIITYELSRPEPQVSAVGHALQIVEPVIPRYAVLVVHVMIWRDRSVSLLPHPAVSVRHHAAEAALVVPSLIPLPLHLGDLR